MQRVDRKNSMVHTPLPSTKNDKHPDDTKKDLNGGYEMALRLAALTKTLKNKVPHKNGIVKTEATPTKQHSCMLKPGTTSSRLLSDIITQHSTTLMKTTSTHLSNTQMKIEQDITKSLLNLRQRQLNLSHTHCLEQVKSSKAMSTIPGIERLDDRSNEATPPLTSPEISIDSLNSSVDSLLTGPCTPDSASHSTLTESTYTLQKHLQCLEKFVDDDATCSSSDEEEEPVIKEKRDYRHTRRLYAKQKWEKDRTRIGSQWAWLCHQVTSINQKIFQLDSLLQSVTPKETIQFTSHNPFSIPCVCGVQNGDTSHKDTNGSFLTSLSKPKPLAGNGLPITPCACQIRQMLLTNPSLVSPQVQVRDILGYSLPVLLMDETSQTCARTRGLKHAPKRKLLRMKKQTKKLCDEETEIDPACHPFLSQPTDISSNLRLDKTLHQILQEHSYASLPLSKRRKAACNLTPVIHAHSVRSVLRLERSKSFSPCSSPYDISCDRLGKGIPRKRNSTNTPSFSDESLSQLGTPTLPKKKRISTTPQYDIDNIIIPYSMAASTRLEKLEYKEIVTPKWRKIMKGNVTLSNGPILNGDTIKDIERDDKKIVRKIDKKMENREHTLNREEDDDEDTSDEMLSRRHAICEENERKRYLNFITGNRKRPRPQNPSTPDSSFPTPSLDNEVGMVLQVLPWPPRRFPLTGKDLELLKKPGLPPKKIIRYVTVSTSSSPSPIPRSETTPHFNIVATPVSSPLSVATPTADTVSEECPLSQWTVVNSSTPIPHQSGIVLKLSKHV